MKAYETVANCFPDAVLFISTDGIVVAVNRRVHTRLGIPAGQVVGKSAASLFHDAPADIQKYLVACARSGDAVIGSLRLKTAEAEGMALRAEGCRCAADDPAYGTLVLLRLVAKEISTSRFRSLNERIDNLSRQVFARTGAETMLREQKSLLEVTLRSIGEGVIVTDTEDRVTFINHVAQVLTGCSGEQGCGRPLEDIFRVSNIRHAHAADHVENETLFGKDGTRRPVDASVASIVDERGIFHGKVVVFRDVSERQEAELRRLQAEGERENLLVAERSARADAERASRMKDEFLATLSHELRTPLSAILGYATLLRVANMNEQKMRHATEIIERNARLQAHLIDDLLDMNRIISGKIRLEIQDLQLPEIVAAALSAILPSLEAKQLKLETQIDSGAGRVDGDPARIQQITWNLLSNAVKFTRPGGTIRVSVVRLHSQVEIQVSDTGQGISAEFLPHVFDRFRQADSAITRRHGGLGLGLSIVRHLVELHGGTVRAFSPGEGQGATFVVSLPVAYTHQAAGMANADRYGPTGQTVHYSDIELSGIRILVVDDEPDATELVQRVLEEYRATVVKAYSASEALQFLADREFHVLISDIGMPEQDGYQLMRHVRGLKDNPNRGIPALALTAFARPEDREQAALVGFQSHLSKPIEAGELLVLVANLAGRTGKLESNTLEMPAQKQL